MNRLFLFFLLLGVFNTASANWKSYLSIDSESNTKEGFAFTDWTNLSPSDSWADDKIEAALVASCNDKGEKSLYVRLLPTYSNTEIEQRLDTITGQIKWDSSYSYDAPFTYDPDLNALLLLSGLDDSLSMISDGNNVTIRIPWLKGQHAEFNFSLNGSSNALKTAFEHCLVETYTG